MSRPILHGSLLVLLSMVLGPEATAQSYVRIKAGSLACQSRTDWTKLSQILDRGGEAKAVRRFLSSLMPHQDCRRIFGGRPVFVQIRSGNSVCIRPLGEFECLWTSGDNLD
jgi:hypothetical protein